MDLVRIKGLDTIVGDSRRIPPKKGVVFTTEVAQKIYKGQQEANAVGMAMIPYCGVCKEPLDWVYRQFTKNPKVGWLECPKCRRKWGTDISTE